MRVRRANLADIPAMIKLERDAPAAGHWSREQYERVLGIPDGPQLSERFVWVAELSAESETLSSQASEILAFLVAHRIDSEWELENIVVAESVRRRGLGAGLVSDFIAHARSEGADSIFLEVRESNRSARALYRKVGFLETGLRRSYYANPSEDAILCRLSLC
jgi:[ribosomal protein S18]-alanine N-acetyltransferase